ncbi:LamG domain-containing protein [Solirubrobacter ginsenosidimutans]|uniref:LamG domain-containing protein n=1 Tax=Solirubrobacter ginsenosidimutans TaxID=490573 RepID=A0A9X3MSA0_9ACTN|nr:LamG-like jellyroll fold domain-containing protein [Solirubrobacter ginsenosidimutans]MDA0160717.1 LamG domain-containing protein [Solirubrobacter ginsenosidimutans]
MPTAQAAPSTAWIGNKFEVDVPNLVRRANIIVGSAPTQAAQLMPLGNGQMGAAVWAAGGFTAQINRTDTWPTRRSPGQVTIPGLATMTGASDYSASVDLYDAIYRQQGGGMTATTYVRADKDELIVDVTGADPNTTQTARINLQNGRNPTAGASGAIGRLAETWVDTGSASGGTGKTFGSLAALTAGGQNVTTSVVDARTVEVSFKPNSDGTFRIIVASPTWAGGDAQATAAALIGTDASATAASLKAGHVQWWHDYWAKVGLMRLSSTDGTADYMENLRTLFLYIEGASERGTFPTSQAGTNPLFNFSRDSQSWGGGHYWFWNLRMQLAANLGAGNADFNLPRFRLYRDNLDAIRSWTTLRMNMRPGICVPETMRFDGSGWYTGTDEGNSSCDSFGPASYNKRNLSTGAEVGLNIWRQYLATDDRAFLENNYPVMADAARFLLAYAVEGADGKLHTSPSNAHETQWDVTDPITDIAAMKSLFPTVIEAAQLLGTDAALVTQLQAAIPKIPDYPQTTRNNQTVFGFSSNPTAAFNNSENLDLEPLFPYNLISDQTTADFELSKTTYANRRNINSNDWSYDAVDAARLGNGIEVASRLRASANSFQRFSNGMADLGSGGTLTNTYDEQVGIVALTLNEALAQDFDGLVRIAPAVPPGWTAEGTVALQHKSKVHVQVQDGAITTAALVNGPTARSVRVKNPWPGSDAQVVKGDDATTVVVPTTSAAILTIPATANGTYLIQKPTAPTGALSKAPLSGTPATTVRHLAQSNAKIGIDPPGTEPPTPCPIPAQNPLFAWDATSGATVRDWSSYARDGVFGGGAAAYLATGPTGTSADISGPRYLRTPNTTLGFLREATWAADVKINAGTTYRRIWDWKTASGGDDVGFLIDLTPTGQVRIITSGRGVTTNAVPPTGRFINLVITAGRDGNLDVYVDGTRIGGGSLPDLGINGCAPAELRFGADQGGGQRISAELDRTAMFNKVLSATDRAKWQSLAFVDAVNADVPIGGTVPQVLGLTLSSASASLGDFAAGVTKEYTSSLTATITTSALNATLSAHDPSSTATGHLVNGTYVMPQALQVKAGTGAFAPVGGASAPTPLLTYSGPKSMDPVAIAFKQAIDATDGLHTGAYGKALTFTLSTTAP